MSVRDDWFQSERMGQRPLVVRRMALLVGALVALYVVRRFIGSRDPIASSSGLEATTVTGRPADAR